MVDEIVFIGGGLLTGTCAAIAAYVLADFFWRLMTDKDDCERDWDDE